jgi:hypothetical protein
MVVSRSAPGRTARWIVGMSEASQGRGHQEGPRIGGLRDETRLPRPGGKSWTVEKWLNHWLEEIARPAIRDSSYRAYKTAVTRHLIPAIGGLRLDQVQPEHLERVYHRMLESGARPGTAHQVHRTIRTALGEAERHGCLSRNPAELVRPPRVKQELVEPFSVERSNASSTRRRSGGIPHGGRSPRLLAASWRRSSPRDR